MTGRASHYAALAATLVVAALAVASGSAAQSASAEWAAESARNEATVGLDIILCLEGSCEGDARIARVEAVLSAVRALDGVEAETVPDSALRESMLPGSSEQEIPSILIPPVIRVTGELFDLQERVSEVLEVAGQSARVQPRNVSARTVAAQQNEAAGMFRILALSQGISALTALGALTAASVARRREEIRMMNMSGVPPWRIRLPHVMTGAAVGAAAGLFGSIAGPLAPEYAGLDLPYWQPGGTTAASVALWSCSAILVAAAAARAGAACDVRDIPL